MHVCCTCRDPSHLSIYLVVRACVYGIYAKPRIYQYIYFHVYTRLYGHVQINSCIMFSNTEFPQLVGKCFYFRGRVLSKFAEKVFWKNGFNSKDIRI
jgi:hypothetical protein